MTASESNALAVMSGDPTEPAPDQGVVDEAVVLEVKRSGMLNTTAGAARVALRLQLRRYAGGRLVAVLLAAGVTEQGTWTMRRITVPAEAARPGEAVRLLGAMLPGLLKDTGDGTLLLADADGAVRAEVLSRSGRLMKVERPRPVPPRYAEQAWRAPLQRWFGHAPQDQHA